MKIYKQIEIVEETKFPKTVNTVLSLGGIAIIIIALFMKAPAIEIATLGLVLFLISKYYGKKPKKVRTEWEEIKDVENYKVEE